MARTSTAQGSPPRRSQGGSGSDDRAAQPSVGVRRCSGPPHSNSVCWVLAETTDISMRGGDIGAILPIAILLMFSFVICYRVTARLPAPTNRLNARGFFWTTAMLA